MFNRPYRGRTYGRGRPGGYRGFSRSRGGYARPYRSSYAGRRSGGYRGRGRSSYRVGGRRW